MYRSLFVRLFVVLALVSQALPVPVVRAAAGDTYVAPSGSDANDCTSPSTPCATINAAIGQAGSGATVFVAVGTYAGVGDAVVTLNKAVTLSGGWDAAFTMQSGLSTIDGGGVRRGISVSNPLCGSASLATAIDRLRIVNVNAPAGGGISVACATFSMMRSEISAAISNAMVGIGGAALFVNSDATVNVVDSLIANSWAAGTGETPAVHLIGALNLVNSTVTGDERQGQSGIGIFVGAYAIPGLSPQLSLRNSTVTQFRVGLSLWTSTVTIENSILAGNGELDCSRPSASGNTVTWTGRNLIGTHNGCAVRAEDIVTVNAAWLGSLKDNGGLTATHAIGPDSPAFGAGVGCSLDHDQREAPRPATCSAGAYEPVVRVQKTVEGVKEPGGTITYTLTIAPPGATPLTTTVLTDTLPAPLIAVPGSASASAGAVALVGNTLTWSGTADPITPPVVSVQAQIDPTAPRQPILNVAEAEWQGFRGPSTQASFDTHFIQSMPALANQFCGDFSDDFSNPAGGWPVFESDLRRLEYVGGEYRLLTKQAGYIYLMGAPTCPRGNQTVEVDLRWVGTPGSDIGLAIEEVGPTGNMYLILIDVTTTYYVVVRYDPTGRPTVLSNGSTHGSMNTGNGTNRLSVDIANGNIRIRNNGWNITDFNYQSSSSLAWVGVGAAPHDNQSVVDARFDNFRVVRFAGANTPSGGSASFAVTAPQLEVFDGRLLPFTTQDVEHDEPALPFDHLTPRWSADRALP